MMTMWMIWQLGCYGNSVCCLGHGGCGGYDDNDEDDDDDGGKDKNGG